MFTVNYPEREKKRTAKVQWIAKPLYEEKSYDYVDGLMEDVRSLCLHGNDDGLELPERNLPRNIAVDDKPLKELAVRQHKSWHLKECYI